MFPFLSALSGEEAAGTPIDPAFPILKKFRLDRLVRGQDEGITAAPLEQRVAAPPLPGMPLDDGTPGPSQSGKQTEVSSHPRVSQILKQSGSSFCEELGIDLQRDSRNALWQWFCAAVLFSARIKSQAGAQACKALIHAGVESPEDMSLLSQQECRQLLRNSGYDRYDDKAAGFLVDDARLLLAHYQGDLSNLRAAAGRDPAQERVLLKKFKGIGDGGVDIFFREVQLIWHEIYPFADKKALKAARLVGFREHPKAIEGVGWGGPLFLAVLPQSSAPAPCSFQVLAAHCRDDVPTFVRLIAALVRMELSKSYNEV